MNGGRESSESKGSQVLRLRTRFDKGENEAEFYQRIKRIYQNRPQARQVGPSLPHAPEARMT